MWRIAGWLHLSRCNALAIIVIVLAAALTGTVGVCHAQERPDASQKVVAEPSEPDRDQASDLTLSEYLRVRSIAIGEHMAALGAAVPRLPAEAVGAVGNLARDLDAVGKAKALLLFLGIFAVGLGAERVLRRVAVGNRTSASDYRITTVGGRLRVVAMRFVLGATGLLVFTVVTVGLLLALDWPQLLVNVSLAYLLAFCAFKAVSLISRVALAPDVGMAEIADEVRILPVDGESARRAHWHVCVLVGWFVFGKATVEAVSMLGLSIDARRLVAYAFGLGLLALVLQIVWQGRRRSSAGLTAAQQFAGRARAWASSVYFALLWVLWVVSAMPIFWLCAVLGGLIAAVKLTRVSVEHLARRPAGASGTAASPLATVCTERALRAVLIIGAASLLVHVWGVNIAAVAAGDSFFMRIAHAGLNILAIGLAADLLWHVLNTLIERQLGALGAGESDSEESRRQARLRTLLPICRKVAGATIFTIAALTILSEAGVQIAPLIAGAGVIGLAVGFGAQTLVRDVFSGFFYLLDDAFRVGEYIQSGNYKGTVESFSIRSVRLRHHRGPLYTVPFGVLGAIQNMSRDWVIDILTVSVTYDTDLDAVKKIIKQVGRELREDPELGSNIIEPLKMQGVDQFGDFAIHIRMKMMTKPGEQFVVRRRAYALIKKAFDSNGIKFAFPTVQVTGGESPAAAAARQTLAMTEMAGPENDQTRESRRGSPAAR